MHLDDRHSETPQPDLTDAIVAAFNQGMEHVPVPLTITRAQIEVRRQRTLRNQDAQAIDLGRIDVSCAIAFAHDIGPERHAGMIALLARRPAGAAGEAWLVQSHSSRTLPREFPSPPPTPVDGHFGLAALGSGIFAAFQVFDPAVRTLRCTVADGSVLEDTAHRDCLLLFVPNYSSEPWADADAPVLQLLDADGHDLLPPNHVLHPHRLRAGEVRGGTPR